jgi:hypothetical protein
MFVFLARFQVDAGTKPVFTLDTCPFTYQIHSLSLFGALLGGPRPYIDPFPGLQVESFDERAFPIPHMIIRASPVLHV